MISHFHHNFMTNGQQCNYHIFGKIIFHQIVLKMCWKCDKCKKKLEEEITFSSQFCHYVKKFVMFPDLSFWAKLWSLYLITLWWKCDENVMNWIWYLFFGSHHLKIPALQKTWWSFTMTMNNEPSNLSQWRLEKPRFHNSGIVLAFSLNHFSKL